MLVFSTQLCELLPSLTFSLVSSPPPYPLLCVNNYTVYRYTVCKGGMGSKEGRVTLTDKHLPQSPFTGNFLDELVHECTQIDIMEISTDGSHHRVHIFAIEMKQGQCICPLSWSVHCNFTGDGKCNERGWACNPHPHQPGLILPS
jgi:hypothetical protein